MKNLFRINKTMKKLLSIILACLCLFLFVGCGGSTGERKGGDEKGEELVLLDYTIADCITLEKFYLPLDTAERTCPVETVNKEIDDGQTAIKAVRKITVAAVDETANNRYHGFFMHCKYTQEELAGLKEEGYKTIVFPIYLEVDTVGSIDLLRGVFSGGKYINNLEQVVYFNSWAVVYYPLSWLVDDYGQINDNFRFSFFVAQPNVDYTFYLGEIYIK